MSALNRYVPMTNTTCSWSRRYIYASISFQSLYMYIHSPHHTSFSSLSLWGDHFQHYYNHQSINVSISQMEHSLTNTYSLFSGVPPGKYTPRPFSHLNYIWAGLSTFQNYDICWPPLASSKPGCLFRRQPDMQSRLLGRVPHAHITWDGVVGLRRK